ncbi:ribonuclease HII [Muricauda sp. JGD-17]|uniref:Ribonuclease HII n=1 Tax=Flagellimonas ochracea TaxID=2696472 RepID=A0A964TDJ9_9FLAO|nr:ribonuclease HII [Allomuricauda ochracea]NAY92249.1 ribonuclease HII [Allomuricauda ochracea]
MKLRVLFFLSASLIISCQKKLPTEESLLGYLPPTPAAILKITNLSNFKSELKNNTFLENTKNFALNQALTDEMKTLDYVAAEQPCLLAIYEIGKENYGFVMVAKNSPDFFDLDQASNKTVETLNYQNHKITKYSVEENTIFGWHDSDNILLSSSQLLMENIVRTKKGNSVDPSLEKLYQTVDPDKSAALFLNLAEDNSLLSLHKNQDKIDHPFSEWVSLDFSANSDAFSLNGVALASDSTKSFISLFKGTSPLLNKTPLVAPLNAQAVVSYTFDDYQVFAKNQNTYLDRVKPIDSLFQTTEEIGLIYLNGQKTVVLHSFGTDGLSEFLESNKTNTQSYQGSEIIGLGIPDLITEAFAPLVQDFQSNFYTILENSFVFAESKEPLQTIINNYRGTSSFGSSAIFTTAKAPLANESSMLFIADKAGIELFAEQEFSPELSNSLKEADLSEFAFASQVVSENDFAHFNVFISKIGRAVESNTVTPLFTLELDTDLAIDPQFVKNHRTNKQEIVVQDQNNVLYLISTDGKVLWSKQLEGRIQGAIAQVDIYKNGRLQLAFCTNNQFMIIDRNGDEVPPFKIDFEGGNLNPLAVFDYEGKKDYRFVITQGRKVYMYGNSGKIVSGFTFKEAESPIIKTPKHFRVGNKDYLVFQLENDRIKILHRVGRERIKVDEKIDFSSNEVFLYRNKISMTNQKGVLHQIDTRGKLTATNFNLNADHGMYATSKTLALMNDNILSIKGKKVELELGVYSKPKIFYIYDKIYVSVTDIQNQKIYMFDSQAEPIANFPVFGSSLIDLTDMDNDKKLELVAKDQENSLIVYKMN